MDDHERIEALRVKLARYIENEGFRESDGVRLGEFNGIAEYSDITTDDVLTLLRAYDALLKSYPR